jgi:hypothetical protein
VLRKVRDSDGGEAVSENEAHRLFGLFLQGCSQAECERKITETIKSAEARAWNEGWLKAREQMIEKISAIDSACKGTGR